jgi:hypothetical protein
MEGMEFRDQPVGLHPGRDDSSHMPFVAGPLQPAGLPHTWATGNQHQLAGACSGVVSQRGQSGLFVVPSYDHVFTANPRLRNIGVTFFDEERGRLPSCNTFNHF